MESKPPIPGQAEDEHEDIKPFSISEVGEIKLNYITGVINKEDGLRFKRLIFRISKGYVWSMLIDLNSDVYGDDRLVFIYIYISSYINKYYREKNKEKAYF